MIHKSCGKRFTQYIIREHNYSFLRCECGEYFGKGTKDEVTKLMARKVWPTIRKA